MNEMAIKAKAIIDGFQGGEVSGALKGVVEYSINRRK
jgi:hypothetical protein